MTKPYTFASFKPEQFPIDIEFIAEKSGVVVHRLHVSGPGGAIIPGLSEAFGPVSVRIRFATGEEVAVNSRGHSIP